ncbi:MAG: T9SS type A sorting domain-containing protein, partial [Flavobacteriia bacterium]
FIALPNPTDGIFGIGGLKHRTEKNIIVTDLMGKIIQQQITREESIQIDLSSNPSGVYLVHIDEYEPVKIVKK